MSALTDTLRNLLEHDAMRDALRAAAILVAAAVAVRLVRRRLRRGALHARSNVLLQRVVGATIYAVGVAWALSELGLNLGVLLGAAGVLTIAGGFAAQTAASNLVSGLFLMVERPFQIGDVIQVGSNTGEVIAIDLLSTKLRTFDNLYVRVPNETVLKSEVTNVTHFPIRRYDMKLGVSYGADLEAVRDALFAVADANPLCLTEPAPLLIILGFGESSIDLQFSVWAARDQFLAMRNSLHDGVKRALDERGIEIPFPQRTLHVAAGTPPLPVRLAPGEDRPAGPV
ncbi:MAG: mechanosensitive ion channel family protein [Deltaproteobacteria bacterium]|nr:MAG: mechanosensitive ion channel family protein [Deltaproteobacteria bacterium]